MSRKKLYENMLKDALFIVQDEKQHFKNIVECIEFVTKCFMEELKTHPSESKQAWITNFEHDLLDLSLGVK